jgi:hypothetical protein
MAVGSFHLDFMDGVPASASGSANNLEIAPLESSPPI